MSETAITLAELNARRGTFEMEGRIVATVASEAHLRGTWAFFDVENDGTVYVAPNGDLRPVLGLLQWHWSDTPDEPITTFEVPEIVLGERSAHPETRTPAE